MLRLAVRLREPGQVTVVLKIVPAKRLVFNCGAFDVFQAEGNAIVGYLDLAVIQLHR